MSVSQISSNNCTVSLHSLATVHQENRQTHLVRRRNPPSSSSRSISCSTAQGCHIYSECIDRSFTCGFYGFSQAFAERRCEAIYNNFRHSQKSCSTCISSQGLFNWVNSHENCFKQSLLDLVNQDFVGLKSDPPNCIQLEKRGLEVMHNCYYQDSLYKSFCSALTRGSTNGAREDLLKIATQFSLNSPYYAPRIERGLSDLVRSCGNQELADSLLVSSAHARRVVLCVIQCPESLTNMSKGETAQMIAKKLNRPSSEFTYSGNDTQRRCALNYNSDLFEIHSSTQLLFYTWHPNTKDPLINNLSSDGYIESGERATIGFYPFEQDNFNETFPECGDGERQAGEICDAGVYNGAEGVGCTHDCKTMPNMECSIRKLRTSTCWMVRCGDGKRNVPEDCDDGNTVNGDGCSSSCTTESGFRCTTSYGYLSRCSSLTNSRTALYPPGTTQPPTTWPPTTQPPSAIAASTTLPPPNSDNPLPSSSPSPASNNGDTHISPSADSLLSPTPYAISSATHLHSRSSVVLLQCSLLTCLIVYLLSAR